MKVRIERIGAGQKEEALLRLAKEDGSTEKLRTYIETDSWKKVSILCKKEEELHRIDSDTVFMWNPSVKYSPSIRRMRCMKQEKGFMCWKNCFRLPLYGYPDPSY